MIQRVQSLYLLLITILMSLMVVLPYAELILGDGQTITFHSYAIEKTYISGCYNRV